MLINATLHHKVQLSLAGTIRGTCLHKRGLFPMAKPRHYASLKKRWSAWRKHNDSRGFAC